MDAQTDEIGRNEAAERARRYLDLATRLLVTAPPSLVAVGGLSGSGKSTLAAALAPTIGSVPGAVVLLRSDVLRKRLFDQPFDARLGQDAYKPAATHRSIVG